MGHGGSRKGAGRKAKADELRVQSLAVSSIESKYGSVEKGFESLLNTGEPSLIKFVWEHAVGKPREKMDIDLNAQTEQYDSYSNDDLMNILIDIKSQLSGPSQASDTGGTDSARTSQATGQSEL